MDRNNELIIDWNLALKATGNNADIAHELLNMLTDSLPQEIKVINELASHQAYKELQQKVHKLHGAVCYCGTPRLKMALRELETGLKNNIMDNLSSLLSQLNIEVNLLLEHCPRQSNSSK